MSQSDTANKNNREKIFSALRRIGKFVVYGLLLGIAINIPFVAKDVWQDLSRAEAFDKIEIGMPSSQVDEILRKADIWCGIRAAKSPDCYFSDFWRYYSVHLDSDLEEVRSKSYDFKERWWIIDRLWGRNTHHVTR